MTRKVVCLLLIIFINLTINGCYGKREINDTAIVLAAGVDYLDNDEIELTVLAQVPIGAKAAESGKSNIWIGVSHGDSIMAAAKNLNNVATKKLLWFHNKIIIVGEQMAKHNMEEIVDFIIRNRENRLTTKILITETTAQEILESPADISNGLPSEISGIVENTKEWSKTYISDMREFMISLSEKNVGSFTGKIGVINSTRDTVSVDRNEYKKRYMEGGTTRIVYVEGLAVFKNNKFIGWFSPDETRGLLWITNKVETGNISIKNEEIGDFSVDIKRGKSEIAPIFKKNSIIMNIKLDVMCRIVEHLELKETADEEYDKTMENLVAQRIKDEIDNMMQKAQRVYNVDLFDFSGIIKRNNPDYWKKIESQWDLVFPEIKVDYDIKVNIRSKGLMGESIY